MRRGAHLLPESRGICIGGEVVHERHLDRENRVGKFFNVGCGIMGMGEGADQDGSDKYRCRNPNGRNISEPAFFRGEKKKQRENIQKISVGERSPSASIVIRHEKDVDQYLREYGAEDKPSQERLFAQEKKDQEEKGREKVPSDPGEPAEKVIKEIIGNEFDWKEMFLGVSIRGHLLCLYGIECYVRLLVWVGIQKCLSFTALIIPFARDPVVRAPKDTRRDKEKKDDQEGFEKFFLGQSEKDDRPEQHDVRRFGKDSDPDQKSG